MNLYHYKYENGVQFVLTINANSAYSSVQFFRYNGDKEKPKLLGVWRLKKINKKQ